ncbi:GAF domain-containing protein [Patulibacter minatonensis]|uniref:GAF domain-containing protein n=1 Tax=Patulibacter minatonensis TaxID=298163 RepID=UPI000688B1DB|nr:GAF domain-containing protein [Patulibacter minatonensis]
MTTPDGDPQDAPVLDARRGAFAAARALFAAADVDALLRAAARAITEALPVARCSVYLREDGRKDFTGRAGHPGAALDEAVRGLRIGGPSDDLIRGAAAQGRSLVARDLQRGPSAATGVLRSWDVTALLAVPLLLDGGTVGFLIADNAGRTHPFTDAQVAVAGEIAALTVATLLRLRAADADAADARALQRRAQVLAGTVVADERLGGIVLRDGGITGLVETGGGLLERSVVVYDANGRRVAGAEAAGDAPVRLHETAPDHPRVRALLDDAPPGGAVAVPALLDAGLRHRHLAAPIDLDGERWGWVVVAERRTRLTTADDRTLRRIAAHVALELTVQRRTALASLDARSTLARLLIRGTYDSAEVARGAAFLGVELRAPRVVAFVGDPTRRTTIDGEALVGALHGAGVRDVLATKGPEGVALMIGVARDVPPLAAVAEVKAAVARACAALDGPDVVAGLSTICRDPHEMPRAYREARETARCLTRTGDGGRRGVLAADDLGAARLFVAHAERAELDRFVTDVLGRLLTDDEPSADLLRTLQSLTDHGRNIRHSAVALGIHENTVRYRLNRVRELTGLDVAADAHAQLSVQTALLVLRLQGHPALPDFGDPATGAPATAEA